MKRLYKVPAAIGMALLGGVYLSALASSATAAQFGVRVVDATGAPVAGASVCFGLPGNYRQFGSLFTDSGGQAITDVPNIPFVVTVSKTRFSGIRINEPGRGFNLIKQITLTDGTPGPRCKAGSTLADAGKSSIVVDRVEVLADADTPRLIPTATGEPTEYRVSTSQEIEFATWSPLEDSIRLPGALASETEVYLQLRRYEGTSTSWLEARSDVVKVYLPPAEESSL